MTDAFRAIYVHWNKLKTRPEVEIVLSIPVEYADVVYRVLGGMPNPAEEVWVAVVRLDPKVGHNVEKVIVSPEPEPTTALAGSHTTEDVSNGSAPDARTPARNPNVTRAIMLCKDKRFQMYLSDIHCIAPTEEDASKFLRDYCGVSSRSQILPDTKAEDLFKRLVWAYEAEDRI